MMKLRIVEKNGNVSEFDFDLAHNAFFPGVDFKSRMDMVVLCENIEDVIGGEAKEISFWPASN